MANGDLAAIGTYSCAGTVTVANGADQVVNFKAALGLPGIPDLFYFVPQDANSLSCWVTAGPTAAGATIHNTGGSGATLKVFARCTPQDQR